MSQLQWDEGCGEDGQRTISCSDHTITSYASLPDGMTMSDAAADYMAEYDHNGGTGRISLKLKLWESYSPDADPDETENIVYDHGDIFDIINLCSSSRRDRVISANGLSIVEDDPRKRVFGDRDEAIALADEIVYEGEIVEQDINSTPRT